VRQHRQTKLAPRAVPFKRRYILIFFNKNHFCRYFVYIVITNLKYTERAKQYGSAVRHRTPYTHWYIQMVINIPGYGQVRLMYCNGGNRCSGYIVRLGRCSTEVQLRISFGLACYVLLVVNLFIRLKVTKAGGQYLSGIISPVHNMTRLWNAPAIFVRLIRIRVRLTKLTVRLLSLFGCARGPNQ
jgi:hypothetical protein